MDKHTTLILDLKYIPLSHNLFEVIQLFVDQYKEVNVVLYFSKTSCIQSEEEIERLLEIKNCIHCHSKLKLGLCIAEGINGVIVTNRVSTYALNIPYKVKVIAIKQCEEITLELLVRISVSLADIKDREETKEMSNMLFSELLFNWINKYKPPKTVGKLAAEIKALSNNIRPTIAESNLWIFFRELFLEGYFENEELVRLIKLKAITSLNQVRKMETVSCSGQLLKLLDQAKREEERIRTSFVQLDEYKKRTVFGIIESILKTFVRTFKRKPEDNTVKRTALRRHLRKKLLNNEETKSLMLSGKATKEIIDAMFDILQIKKYITIKDNIIHYNVINLETYTNFQLREDDYQWLYEKLITKESEGAILGVISNKEYQKLVKLATQYLVEKFPEMCLRYQWDKNNKLEFLQVELYGKVLKQYKNENLPVALLELLHDDKITQDLIIGNALNLLKEKNYVQIEDQVVTYNTKEFSTTAVLNNNQFCKEVNNDLIAKLKQNEIEIPNTIGKLINILRTILNSEIKKLALKEKEKDKEQVLMRMLKLLLDSKHLVLNQPIVLSREGFKGNANTPIVMKI